MGENALDALLKPGLPNVISVELTNACNLVCPMCPRNLAGINGGSTKGLLPEAAWRAIMAVAARIGLVNLNGLSENFLHPHFLDLVEELQAQGARATFSTNGTLITPRIAARLADLRGLDTVNVSLDSADPEEYRLIRGGDLERVRTGLRHFVEATRGSLRITVSAVVMRLSQRGVPLLPAFLADVGVKNLVLQTVVDPSGTSADQQLPENAAQIVAAVAREGARLGINVLAVPFLEARLRGETPNVRKPQGPELPEGTPLSKVCTSPWEHVAVDWQGNLFPCCNSPSWQDQVTADDVVMGTLGPRSFEEVWSGSKMQEFRRGLLTGQLPRVCEMCPVVGEGVHPFVRVGAQILMEESRSLRSGVRIVAKNTGTETWTAATGLRIAPSRPRDRDSGLKTSRWVSWHRAAHMNEVTVAPGGKATFDVPLAVWRTSRMEIFQLVAEGLCWVPNTEVAVVPTRRWIAAWPPGRWRFEVRPAPATIGPVLPTQ